MNPPASYDLVVLGAGVIGCEVASIFAAFGVDVQLVDSQPHVLSSEDEDVSTFLERVYERNHVVVRQRRRVRSVDKRGESGSSSSSWGRRETIRSWVFGPLGRKQTRW